MDYSAEKEVPGLESDLQAGGGAGEDQSAEPEEVSGESEGQDSGADVDELKAAQDKYVRLFAEFENYRKRMAREREDLLSRATEKVVSDILTVIDHLELALQHRGNDSAEALIQGVEITLREFRAALEKNGVTAIEAKGLTFDPSVHHAMTQIETTDAGENSVVEEFRKGYRIGERVIRPALVAVARRPAADGPDV